MDPIDIPDGIIVKAYSVDNGVAVELPVASQRQGELSMTGCNGMESDKQTLVIHGREARLLCDAEEDLAVRQLLECVMTAITLEHMRSGATPDFPVDLTFVLTAARRFFSNKQLMERIVQGEDVHWFRDD